MIHSLQRAGISGLFWAQLRQWRPCNRLLAQKQDLGSAMHPGCGWGPAGGDSIHTSFRLGWRGAGTPGSEVTSAALSLSSSPSICLLFPERACLLT